MAIDQAAKSCNIVLHDDRVSSKDVLSGTRVLHVGEVAYLSAPGATTLCVTPAGVATNSDEISIHVSLAQSFGFGNRIVGTLSIVEAVESATADHVELFFRDQHLSRADMWQLMSCVDESVVYQGQTLRYLGSASAEVQRIYIGGAEVQSALVAHPQTKPIFRSGSARFTILVEISNEMLESWVEGELLHERLIDGFLPELFRRWDVLKVRHVISIVLFGRRCYDMTNVSPDDGMSDRQNDFFWVLVSELTSMQWPQMLRKLRRAFNDRLLPQDVSLSSESNMLEAIHLAALDFADDQYNTRPMSTGTSIIAVTAGAGLFNTHHALLKRTTDLLIGNSIGVDIVALSPKPLQPVPLFRYSHRSTIEYALPHWVDISFWKRPEDVGTSRWIFPRTEDPVNDIAIEELQVVKSSNDIFDAMDDHDEGVFQLVPKPILETALPPHEVSDVALVVTTGSPDSDNVLLPGIQDALPVRDVDSTPALPDISRQDITDKPKWHGLPPHSLMYSGRKISLGPKGLAPSRGVASTTISVAHAQHEKDLIQTGSSSGIAKAIRASLARKPSQQSLASRRVSEPDHNQGTRPIDIHNLPDSPAIEPADPASLIEKRIADSMIATNLHANTDLSETLKPNEDSQAMVRIDVAGERLDMQSPWVLLLNPCNPRRDNIRTASQYRKWQHVFPRAISSGAFKWASMCSPAALPITTEYRPSVAELERHYVQMVRRHIISHSPGLRDETAQVLIERLINIRLVRGFQMVAIADSGSEQTIQNRDRPILLALGRRYHELRRLSDFEVQIVQYEPKTDEHSQDSVTPPTPVYRPRMRMPNSVTMQSEVTYVPEPTQIDWAQLDEHILGLAPLPDTNALFKLRLVLLPVEVSKDPNAHTRLRELSDDERRIEGIQKLTQMWQRQRFFSAEDKQHQVSLRNAISNSTERDPNPLAVDYQTRDPSLLVNSHGPMLSTQLDEEELTDFLFAESDKHHSSNFDITKLIKQMQESPPYGVAMRDRRWLTQTHLKCFRGDELTTWLLGAFKDVHSRDDAVAVGNELMTRGVFAHVRAKHRFRDGHYFYQITGAHRTTVYPDSTGLFSKAPWRSVPATPTSESVTSPLARPISGDSTTAAKITPVLGPSDHMHLLLSQVLQYNVDVAKKSDHLHIVNLHYDRIHHPDNCYHIRLEWFSASSKLIKESISRWNALVEPHGLRLLQVPLEEASMFQDSHPFDRPQPVKLVVKPPDTTLVTPLIEPHTFMPRQIEDRAGSYKTILRRKDFVLDYEAASAFSSRLQVSYSWGRPNYNYTQFVHRSGLVIAQIVADEDCDFILLPNRLASSRMSASMKQNESDVTAETVMTAFKAFCQDEEALRQIYKEIEHPRTYAPSPLASVTSTADIDVPPMQLPPHLIHRIHGPTH